MKSKCSFILKAGLSLVLCFVLLFGTGTTSLAAVVQQADTGAKVDLAETGWNNIYFYGDPVSWSSSSDLGTSGEGSINVYLTDDSYYRFVINNNNIGPWSNGIGAGGGYKAHVTNDCFCEGVEGLYTIHCKPDGNGETTPWVWISKIGDGTAYIVGDTDLGLTWTTDTNAMTGVKGTGYTYTSIASGSASGSYNFKIQSDAYNNQWPSSGNFTVSNVTAGARISYTFWPQTNSASASVEHAVSTSFDSNGSLSANKSYVANGSTVTFTATPDTGYEVDTFTINGTAYTMSNNQYTYTLSSDAAVSASVTFKLKTYTISYDKGNGTSGTVASTTKTHGSAATLSSGTFTRSGYTQDGWATSADGAKSYDLGATTYATEGDATLYAHWAENLSTITVSKSPAAADGTVTGVGAWGGTVSAGVATTASLTAADGSNYTFLGWYVTGNAVISDGTNDYTSDQKGDSDHILASNTVTVKGDGTASGTGSVVAVYILSKLQIDTDVKLQTTSGGAYSVNGGAGSVTPASGLQNYNGSVSLAATSSDASIYHFVGWAKGSDAIVSTDNPYVITVTEAASYHAMFKQGGNVTFYDTDGSNNAGSIIQVSGNNTNFYYTGTYADAPSDPSLTGFTFSGWATSLGGAVVDVATNGITANTNYYAVYAPITYTITVTALGMDNATSGYDVSLTAPTASPAALTGVGYNSTIEFTPAANSGYEFVGWVTEKDTSDDTQSSFLSSKALTSGDTVSITTDDESNTYYHIYALYKKVYNLTFFKTWDQEEGTGRFIYRSAPPRTVTVNGTTTYTYSESTTSTSEGATATAPTYHEGDLIRVLAGDTVVATYSALASSDVITAVHYNNDIRLTTSNEIDNKYINGRQDNTSSTVLEHSDGSQYYEVPDGSISDDDWGKTNFPYVYTSVYTLAADKNYFTGATKTVIDNNDESYIAEVVQSAHTVTWTVADDYKNIDLEFAAKKQFIFSDTANTVIHSVNTDNFYSYDEAISTGDTADDRLAVYAAGNANQTNTITKNNVKLYHYDYSTQKFTDSEGVALAEGESKVEVSGITVNISDGLSIANSGATASTEYIYFTGNMPATDVYVDLDLVVTYSTELGTKIVSDEIAGYAAWSKVARVTVSYDGDEPTTNGNYDNSVPNDPCDRTVVKGKTLTYTTTFWDTINDEEAIKYSKYYMFLGWYKGDSSGPDLDNGLLSEKTTFTYKPTANVVVYAVGTRDLFINGTKYITGASEDWNLKDGVPQNFKMSFDAANGRYYWKITDTIFESAGNSYNKGGDYYESGGHYYWNNSNNMGNSWFRFMDEATGYNCSLWANSDDRDFVTTAKDSSNNNMIHYGKIRKSTSEYTANQQYGFIYFNETTYNGYSSPLYIYYTPGSDAKGKFTVEPSYVYPNIYVSNGYKGIDTGSDASTAITSVRTSDYETLVQPVYNNAVVDDEDSHYFNITSQSSNSNYGWNPDNEGRVYHYKVEQKDATVRVSRKVSSDNYKVSSFIIYDVYDKSVSAKKPTAGASNTYYVDITMQIGHDLYIVPVIEKVSETVGGEAVPNVKVVVDATQLKTSQWGYFVGCYAWYATSGAKAYGDYPGQLMVPSDDHLTFTANFPATDSSGNKLVGITFSNYYDGSKTWLGGSGVMGSGNIIPTYNSIGSGSYAASNCKVQTYDYREPVAFYENRDPAATEFLLNFALKQGNSSSAAALTARHTELTASTTKIPGTFAHTHSNGTTVDTLTISASDFEYLTGPDGVTYVDLNGYKLTPKTPSFYVIAKGEVNYSSGSLQRVFYSENHYEGAPGTALSPAITYPSVGSASGASVSQHHAVQWYVYDASGNFITSMLSAGYADKTTVRGSTSLIAQALLDAGYAVEGRAVAICYDSPRYCYSDIDGVPNGGSGFNTYRFTGQWYQQSAFDTANVYGEVGMLTDNEPEFAGSSTPTYGSVTISVDPSKLTHTEESSYYGTDTTPGGIRYGYTTIADGDKQAITLTATAQNFAGWYYYDGEGNLTFLTKDLSITPTYSKDVTYYAMYEARATYSYLYTGREENKSYNVDAGSLSEEEMNGTATGTTAANQVATDRTDFGTKAPGANSVSIFKKTVTWASEITAGMLDNSTAYTMKITGAATITDETFTLTYYKPASVGAASTVPTTYSAVIDEASTTDIPYNTVINLRSVDITSYAGAGRRFVGWFEYDPDTSSIGKLLSVQANYGMVITKDTTIIAVYSTDTYSMPTDGYHVAIDDQQVTREMYTATSGMYYNDVIISATYGSSSTTELPEGAVVGVLYVDDNGTGNKIAASSNANTITRLTRFAVALSEFGARGTYRGCTITNVFSDSVTRFGRADVALRADYNTSKTHTYYVYAYVLIDGNYYFDLVNAYKTGTYAAYSAS